MDTPPAAFIRALLNYAYIRNGPLAVTLDGNVISLRAEVLPGVAKSCGRLSLASWTININHPHKHVPKGVRRLLHRWIIGHYHAPLDPSPLQSVGPREYSLG